MSRLTVSATARVAAWLHRAFEDAGGYLDREDATDKVDGVFGPPFSQMTDAGNLRIAPEVLAAFRARSPDAVRESS